MADEQDFYPLPAFRFSVGFAAGSQIADTSFQEVSGIAPELETEEYAEGGENRFVHQLPKGKKYPRLVLKRGLARVSGSAPAPGSPPGSLAHWCMSVLQDDTLAPVTPYDLTVRLLDAEGQPVAVWNVVKAYPVKWEVEGFDAMKNELAIERVELCYNYSTRQA